MTSWSFLASGFGVGHSPKAPGTCGSLLGLVFGALLLHTGHLPLLFASIVVTALGVHAVGTLPEATQDPGWVVIDEVAGQMITMLALPRVTLAGLIVAFAVFRFFDILKPGPIAWADRRHDEFGVMGDDVIAGVLAAVMIVILRIAVPV